MRIATNVPGLRAMRSNTAAEKRIERLSARLSTGIRINSAKDDPTGSAISKKLKVQTGGTKVAEQNALNAVSVLQTADAALNEISAMLQRMRELAVEASNDTLTSGDRLKLQIEIDLMKEEIDSVSDKAEYNGTKLLNGHAGLRADSDNARMLSLTDNIEPGTYAFTVDAQATAASVAFSFDDTGFPSDALAGYISVNGIEVEVTSEDTGAAVLAKLTEAFTAAAITVDMDAANNPIGLTADYYGAKHGIEISSGNAALLAKLGFGASVSVTGTDAQVTLGAAFGTATAIIDGNRITVNGEDNRRMTVEVDPAAAVGAVVEIEVSNRSLIFHTGSHTDINTEISISKISTESLGIDRLSVVTIADAQRALGAADAAVSECSRVRGKVGSYESRLEFVGGNLENSDIALEKAMSKVFDTDMAYELAELSRNQILSQGAMAIMGQANQRPQNVLMLLK